MNIQEYNIALATTLERNQNPSAVARESEMSHISRKRFLKTIDLKKTMISCLLYIAHLVIKK